MRFQIIRHINKALLLIGMVTLSACYYDNEAELYPGFSVQPCDTLDLSYGQTIASIIDAHCNKCHSSTEARAGIILDSHAALMNHVNSGALLGTIQHNPAFSAMPKNEAKLSNCKITQIKAWIEQGAKNN